MKTDIRVIPEDKVRTSAIVEGYEYVVQKIFHALKTFPGEVPFDPEFGVGVERFLFEFADPDMFEYIASQIQQEINDTYHDIYIESVDWEYDEHVLRYYVKVVWKGGRNTIELSLYE